MPALRPNILVIRRRYLGDLVLLGPLLRNLRLHWRQALLTALVEPAYAEVLTLNPDLDEVMALPAGAGGWWRFLRRLRAARFTHVFDLDNTEKTAWLTRWTRADFRAALLHELPVRLARCYSHVVVDPPAEHERRSIAEYFLQPLAAAGVPVLNRDVRLVPREADLAFARDLPDRLFASAAIPGTRLLLVHPGSRSPFRLWPVERFGEVCRRTASEIGARVLVTAGPGEEEIVSQIVAHAGGGVRAVPPPLSLPRFAALASQCDAVLCHDSGPMHVAAAVDTPVVALFGSQNLALWRPADARHRLLQAPMPCQECVAPGVCVPEDSYRSYCVRRLSADTVFGALREVLGGPKAVDPRLRQLA